MEGGRPTLPPAVAHPRCLPRALYTYEDGSDDLKLAASGGKVLCPCSRLGSAGVFPSTHPGARWTWADGAVPGGGLLELSGRFEIQKVMYGFCSVKDPQAVLPKYVLVNWVSGGTTLGGPCPPGAAVLAGAWLGAREEPVVAGRMWVPHGLTAPWWSVGWGSPCRPSLAQPLPGCHRWARTCRMPASVPAPATWPRLPSSSRWVMLGRGTMLPGHRPRSLTAARPPSGRGRHCQCQQRGGHRPGGHWAAALQRAGPRLQPGAAPPAAAGGREC